MRRSLLHGAALALLFAAPAQAAQDWLITGNGHGFQVIEGSSGKLVAFHEAPYRFLRAGSSLQSSGVTRRNLASSFAFGVQGSWLAGIPGTLSYVDHTHIARLAQVVGDQPLESYFFAPFDFAENASIALIHATSAQQAFALAEFELGAAEALRYDAATEVLIESGSDGGAMIYAPIGTALHLDCENVSAEVGSGLGDKTDCSGENVTAGVQLELSAGWGGVALLFAERDSDAESLAQRFRDWQASRGAEALLQAARDEFSAWRRPLPENVLRSDDERNLWLQSEAVLRMGQVRVPNREGDAVSQRSGHGMILASLPSWKPSEPWMDWSMAWTRDSAYAIVPLARAGYVDEAKGALQAFMMAGPVGTKAEYFQSFGLPLADLAPYRISVTRYFGNGEEESDWGSGPNAELGPDYNVQLDGWGLYLWAARQYVSADPAGARAWLDSPGHDGRTVYELLLDEIARPLEACLERQADTAIVRADSSIWENHNNNQGHFAYTTLAAARGFCDLAAVSSAYRGETDADVARFEANFAALQKGLSQFQHADGGLRTTTELVNDPQRSLDGSVVEALNFGLFQPGEPGFDATLDGVLESLRVASGGFKRRSGYSGNGYENDEWLLLDFRIAEAYLRRGDTAAAEALVAPIVTKAAEHLYLLPELYNANAELEAGVGAYTGSRPMVGYGHGAFIHYALNRALLEDGAGRDPALTAEGAPNCREPLLPTSMAAGGSAGAAGAGGTAGAGGATSAGGGGGGATSVVPTGGRAALETQAKNQPESCACNAPGRSAASRAWAAALLVLACGLRRRRR
jgi:GH15 family glucan-1,4-alpha-glucosidase